jgi:signal transduction histidine kinase
MVMRSEVDITKRTKEYECFIKNMEENISSMQGMIDTLLTLTRLQAQEVIDKKDISLEDIINDVIAQQKKKHTDKDMKITMEISSENQIKANEQLAKIMINNILDNARKYAPAESTIHIAYENNTITVQNTGTISQDIIENMWTPFRQ